MLKKPQRNIILFVGKVTRAMTQEVREFEKKTGRKFRIAVFKDARERTEQEKKDRRASASILISCDASSPIVLTRVLKPYHDELLAVTCRGERQIPLFAKIIPAVPYLRTPTSESLLWATDKIAMRRRFAAHDKTISPGFAVVKDTSRASLKKIEERVKFPLMVKPSGLAASLLVNICYHRDELSSVLRAVFRKIRRVYKEAEGRGTPKVLVEQFMEGEMYSIDAYVTSRGRVFCCPLVHVKTGRSIGFDDFFGYMRITPVSMSKENVEAAETVVRKAVFALGLRSTTAHVELMKTEKGWKVIEVGPRVGGFRHAMYSLSYGINHTMNDILVRIPEKPVIPKKIKGYTAVLQFFARKEGTLNKLQGVKKIQELSSFKTIDVKKKIGDKCTYAKHGGSSVMDVTLFNKDRSKLLADVRRLEQMVRVETE